MGNKPRIRFKGFTEDWEQRKLDELTMFIGDGLHGTPKYDENGSYYFINGNNLVDNKVSVTEETKKVAFEALGNDDRRLDSTAILMSINGTIGTLARYNNENIMLGKSVAYITPKNINRDFLFYQLQGNVIQSYFYKNLTGTTIKNLGLGTIKNTIVMSTLSEEESTIGRFFYKLDQYITLHQCKLEKLKLTKKALLQKLFPKNGKHIPEIRFKGFTDAWEQRKLGDIATFSKGNGYSKSDLAPSGEPIILYGRLYTNYETTISNVDTFVELKDKSVISQGGEVIVPASGETAEDISRASVVKNQGIILGGDLNVIKVNHLLDPTFLALTISNGEQQKELSKRAQGKSVVHLHNSDLQEVNLTFPMLTEQKEISSLFEKMDSVITLHQRKLERLQEVKKGLLQKMFV
ncbi:restriction endonuclease subunit S [Veillonella atypica]|uniref:restriction endonuclease subunit S n=1 Tax=Veillonella atypica TaxID=39777 RepID=UPI003AF4603F